MADATCPCGAVLEPSKRRPRKFCSKKCTRAFYYRQLPASADEQCITDGCTRRSWAKRMCLIHWKAEYRRERAAGGNPVKKSNKRRLKVIVCVHCGKSHSVYANSPARFCSLKCSAAENRHINAMRRSRVAIYTGPPFVRKPRINKNPIPQSNRKFKSVSCRVCGSWFVTLYTDVTCSAKCQKVRVADEQRTAGHRRRARKRGAFVADVWRKKVFELDGYRCHLCNRKCKKVTTYLKGSTTLLHPLSPTIDHVIPLAKGGTHEPGNCRTACNECNCRKSHFGGGEQFALAI